MRICWHNFTKTLLDIGHNVHVYDIMWFGNFLPEQPGLTVTQGDIREIEKFPWQNGCSHTPAMANDPCSDLNSKLTGRSMY